MYNKITGIYNVENDRALIEASRLLAENGYVARMRQVRGHMAIIDFVKTDTKQFNDLEDKIVSGGK